MKTFTKVALAVFLFIVFLLAIFPSSPLRSLISKNILSNHSILSELNLNKENCHYEEPTMFIESRDAAFVCITDVRYKLASDAQKEAIDEMRGVLEKNGWTFSESESWKHWDIIYHKGLREVRIYPYDWGPGCTGVIEDGFDSCKLFIRLQ